MSLGTCFVLVYNIKLALACAWVYNLHTDGRAQSSKTAKMDSSQLCLLVHALCLCINQLALACAWVYNLHTDGRAQYSKRAKIDSSQLCLLVHALCLCIISTTWVYTLNTD